MARKPRIHYPGAVYHVILRGNAGEPLFFKDRDRFRFYLHMQEVIERFRCRIHGFCCMTNHVHLILQVEEIPLSRIMQSLSLKYTRWINYTRRRTGHLFQGRYKAIMLDADAYLLELVRYVHLNPVRAGMTECPEGYRWSGHNAYLGKEMLPWLTTEWVLALFSGEINAAIQHYRQFLLDGIAEGRRNEFHSGTCEGRILGDDCFADKALTRANQHWRREWQLDELIDAICRRYGIAAKELKAPGKKRPFSEARAVAAVLVQESPHLTLTELGKVLQRDITALGKAAQRLIRQADARLIKLLEELRGEMEEMSESQA
ncbi:transposase, Y1_Tnp domain-containing [Geotalea daltonii FRC-32]|uniref:Transposase, Y1_Tnp domain-containing n=1 Tax=Geotalea daltonii (strain DSM 22248 / JCM 15807 / FRC-32) TaxID=316067 RepID=B9M2M1_GEODF|nr:transposase [Geotalea daltonii]ACM19400.1 transposase, Y1_Tnp domain-containing [Geotalea daltonii FRC-32]